MIREIKSRVEGSGGDDRPSCRVQPQTDFTRTPPPLPSPPVPCSVSSEVQTYLKYVLKLMLLLGICSLGGGKQKNTLKQDAKQVRSSLCRCDFVVQLTFNSIYLKQPVVRRGASGERQLEAQWAEGDRGGSLQEKEEEEEKKKGKHDSLIASFWAQALSRKQPFLSDCRSGNKRTFLSLLNAPHGTEHAEAGQKEKCLLR